MNITKRCTTCGLELPLDQFGNQPGRPHSKRARCRSCAALWMRDHRARHPRENAQRLRAYYQRNKEILKAKQRAYRLTPKGWAVNAWVRLNNRTINGAKPYWRSTGHRYYLEHGIRLEMTKTEFYAWVLAHWADAEAIQRNGKTPSIDRVDSKGHYSLDNIRIIENRLNTQNVRSELARIRNAASAERDERGRFRTRRCATPLPAGGSETVESPHDTDNNHISPRAI